LAWLYPRFFTFIQALVQFPYLKLEIVMRRYERASTLLTSNRPVEDWGKLLGDAAAVSAMLDRLLHHGHVLKCGPRSWRTKTDLPPHEAAG
jgi:DNA replication protein DnaC